MKDTLTQTVIKQRHQRREIQYWQAIDRNSICIDANNSIAILRARHGYGCTYRAVR